MVNKSGIDQKLLEKISALEQRIKELEESARETEIVQRTRAETEAIQASRKLQERVKELNCLYTVSEIVRRDDITEATILRQCAELLAKAYLYPDITECCIIWEGRSYSTGNFQRTDWMQSEPINVHGVAKGAIEISYLEERPEEYIGPFLAEECRLLRSIADLIGRSTERKEAERTLEESRRQFKDLVETMYDWVWEIDAKGRYTYVSPQVRNILGYEPEELLGKTPFEFMSFKDAGRLSEAVAALIKETKPIIRLESVNVHEDGRQVVLETNGLPFHDTAGTLKGYRGTNRDISDRRRREEEREKLIGELQDALSQVSVLSGLLPICALCKKIRDDKGTWEQLEVFIRDRSGATFTHGYCPECMEKLRSELNKDK